MYKASHPPSPLHTRRLKSQHYEIITTFPNSTARYGFAPGGGVHLPLSSPALRFIPLGFRQATVNFSTLFIFKRLPSQDTNAITDSFYGTELGLHLLHLVSFSSRSDRLAPYWYFTFLAGTHNYLAGIHNYFFFTIQTMTTVHHGLPL